MTGDSIGVRRLGNLPMGLGKWDEDKSYNISALHDSLNIKMASSCSFDLSCKLIYTLHSLRVSETWHAQKVSSPNSQIEEFSICFCVLGLPLGAIKPRN